MIKALSVLLLILIPITVGLVMGYSIEILSKAGNRVMHFFKTRGTDDT